MTYRKSLLSSCRIHLWFAWNRTRYYWPQAKARKRAGERLREEYAKLGEDWKPPRHWLIPMGWW